MKQLNGKCHCGKNTFSINAEPEFQFKCYCKECRSLNSSGHLCGMMFDTANLTKANETHTYTYQGGSGSPIEMHFCPQCATHLYAYPKAYEGKVVIRPNTLVDAEFSPQQSLFTESAFEWDKSS